MIDKSILRKFKNNECSPSEKQELLQLFKEHPELLEEVMSEEEWNAFHLSDNKNSEVLFKEIYSNIETEMGPTPNRSVDYKRYIGIAVIVVCALVIGKYYFMDRGAQMETTRLVQAIQGHKDTTVINQSNTARKIPLPDGSLVKLFPGSSIRYQKEFADTKRNIALNGKGVFYAARDDHRPFTVYAGNIATTALGTVFMISADQASGKVDVHLFKGKVAIRKYQHDSLSQVIKYLSPGSSYSNVTEKTIQKPIEKRTNDTHARRSTRFFFNFKNSPLEDLLDSLSQQTGIQFHYKEKEIRDMTFTGAYDNKDQTVDELLTTIGTLNGFVIEKKDSTNYIINVKR
ncbi:FecR family protein [Arachidicoccus terrestris]|uniref:FecR family protein n=1 Tax=Arachidicoccus terrestris TaxID=2875539 RepID=UPI001CC4CF54|nr:FecR family protein [Arachidicoccus terrestris]UAY56971.1 FecR family protein [Arachidicoccus terrestris]